MCGWYCYDKYGEGLLQNFNSTSEPDLMMVELERLGKELYPTKEKLRSAWIAGQMAALQRIEIKRKGVPASMRAEIRAFAAKKYPKDFDKQLEYITAQESAAIAIRSAIRSFDFPAEETKLIVESVARIYSGDYATQASSILRLGSALTAVKQKWQNASPKDYAAVMPKVLEKLAEDPDEAIRFLDAQLLARHNYLAKKFPTEFGDLREGIESAYPNDFIAQLDELDKRLDSAIRKGKKAEVYKSKKSYTEFARTKAYIKRYDKCFACYFVILGQKPAIIFSSKMLDYLSDGVLEGSYIDVDFKTSDIYISRDSSVCCAILNDVDKAKLPCLNSSFGELESFYDRRIMFCAPNKKSGVMMGYDSLQLKREFTISAFDVSRVLSLGETILAVDALSAKVLGFLDMSISSGGEILSEKHILTQGQDAMPASDFLRRKVQELREHDTSAGARIIMPSGDSSLWCKFNYAEYISQRDALRNLVVLNYEIADITTTNEFAKLASTTNFSAIFERFKKDFTTAPRMHKNNFLRRYSTYISEIRERIRMERLKVDKMLSTEIYHTFKKPIELQAEILREYETYFSTITTLSLSNQAYINTDLREKLKGDAYVPKFISDERKAMNMGRQ